MLNVVQKRHILKGFAFILVMTLTYFASRKLLVGMCVEGRMILGLTGVAADVLFHLLSVALILGMLPRTLLCIFSGVIYSDFRAFVYVLLASGIASLIGYAVGGRFFNASVERIFRKRKWFHLIKGWSVERPQSTIIFIRMVVRSNYGLTNLMLGSIGFPLKAFFWGTLLAITPATLAWVYVGQVVGCQGLSGLSALPEEIRNKLIVAGTILTALGFIPLLFGKLRGKMARS